MVIISAELRSAFREYCVRLSMRVIADCFEQAGVKKGTVDPAGAQPGMRRGLVEDYYSSLDWSKSQDADKFLKAMSLVLAQLSEESARSELQNLCSDHGLEVVKGQVRISGVVSGPGIKNLIFAADGPKPQIVIEDAINNDIRIVQNAEYCLVFDDPIYDHGLLWNDLVLWWSSLTSVPDSSEAARSLYRRLARSLGSEPERLLFKQYFHVFHSKLGQALPALIPQVYLHYDPYTIKQLGGGKRLVRQRMDFLLLLRGHSRVVIEVDGRQHYALEDGTASPERYSEMVAEDRRLRLAGYELYRFGAYELRQADVETVVSHFFDALFEKHAIG